ncbi:MULTISPECIES: 30S ribosome-binding factor RbfA [Amylolactobacillus]|nr:MULTISPECIES: 30S ribosome-binding factor RbfA [Amylolactobacillus]APT17864.1 ribosome-binding factor A [Amylolactobacillus amylophilus DSM 20533 = JCM 1125]GED79791.1 ribosome-binding factor A [Amylolactobacillus amylophilus]
MKHRVGRVEQETLREITDILRKKIRDPRVADVTITAVEVTKDLSYATIFYSTLNDDPASIAEVEAGLEKAKGMMRHELGQRLTIYKVPELIFKRDQSVEYGSRIDELIRGLNNKD